MRRLFIATKVELSEANKALREQLHYDFRHNDMVWVQDHVAHLTLRFIGKTPEQQVMPLKNVLKDICDQNQPFELTLDKLGIFGSRYKPQVLWIGFQDFFKFQQLFEQLEPEILKLGFDPYRGNFIPHITLARIKGVVDKPQFWQQFERSTVQNPQTIPIHELTLYQSFLHPNGPEYKPLATYQLKG